MRLVTLLSFSVGLLLVCYLVFHFGAGDVFAGVAAAGWGVVWVSLYRFVTLLAHGAGWRALFPRAAAPGLWIWFRARWAGEAINSLLPVAQVGGDVARAQMVARYTQSGALAGATVAVDFTLGLVAQFVYTLAGAALLAGAARGNTHGSAFVSGLLIAACVLAGLWLAQSSNLLGRIAGRLARGRGGRWTQLAGNIADWNRESAAIFSDHRRVTLCFAGRISGWLLLTGETWLILYFLGHTVGWPAALILESLSMAVRSASFALPGALGAQEAGFVVLGPMVGISAETALALALVKRIRELLVGVPGLWVWFASEKGNLARLRP